MTTIGQTGQVGQGNPVTGPGTTGVASEAGLNPPAAEPAKKIRVLLVDDESLVRRVIKAQAKFLRPDRFEFVEAENSAEALKILETDKNFDLIISDKDMPSDKDKTGKDDGITLIKERPQDIKLILMSSDIASVTDESLNIDRKIEKPITDPAAFFNTIDAVLSERVAETPASIAARAREFKPEDHTILIVNENEGTRDALGWLFTGYKYKVIKVDHNKALDILKSGQPVSVILSNNGFKTKNAGLDLRRAIIKDGNFSNIPFVLCSADVSLVNKGNELSNLGITLISGAATIDSEKIESVLRSVITTPQ